MTDFQPADLRPYEQTLWHKPPDQSPGLWHEPRDKFGSIPEPLYRLRLSVLHNSQGRDDCPARIYLYPTLAALTNATNEIQDSLGGAFPKCQIQLGGLSGRPASTTDEAVMAGVDDARTSSVVLLFDSQSADESWKEFVRQVESLEKRWTVETEGE